MAQDDDMDLDRDDNMDLNDPDMTTDETREDLTQAAGDDTDVDDMHAM